MMHRRGGRWSEACVRGLWPGGDDEGRTRRSSKDVRGRGKVGGRTEGVWEVRGSCVLRELRPSRAVLQG